jgi:S-adenosylmethionine decarboxylase
LKLTILLAALGGCDPAILDDREAIEAILRRMVEAARFTLFSLEVVRFSPRGVTGAAIVGESHIAIHTWPEEGRLFADIASCTTEAAAERAIEALKSALRHETITISAIDYAAEHGFVGKRG